MKKHFFALTVTLVLGLLFLQSCSKDKDDVVITPSQIVLGDTIINLDNSNIYLVNKSTYRDSWIYWDYVISDGVLQQGLSSENFSSYDKATYHALIELAVREGDVVTGEYPQFYDWMTATGDSANMKISYVYIETNNNSYGTLRDDVGKNEPVIVTGGVNDGEEMSINLISTLLDEGNNTPIDVNIMFKGIVNNVTTNSN